MPKVENVEAFDQLVLATVRLLGRDAYSVTIRSKVMERDGRDVAIGAIYATLNRLETKGYVISRKGDRARRYFDLTDTGRTILRERQRIIDRLRGIIHFTKATFLDANAVEIGSAPCSVYLSHVGGIIAETIDFEPSKGIVSTIRFDEEPSGISAFMNVDARPLTISLARTDRVPPRA